MQSFWKRLPAAARALLAAACVLALSLALTFALHNQDTWRTGLWDDTSQSLVFGRILQMQHGQSAPGGFLGTYAVDGDTAGNRYLFRENAVPDPDTFISYSHQTGLQGAAFGILNKVYSLFARGGEARERMLYATNAVLFYAATLVLAGAAWRAFGPLAGAGWLAAAVFSPWLQRGMKDIYWCTWTWLLPALAGLAVWALARRRGRVPPWGYALVFAAVLVRCMCGFEFISDFLILCETFLSLLLLSATMLSRLIGIAIGGEDFTAMLPIPMLLKFVLGNYLVMLSISGICFLSSAIFNKSKLAIACGGGIAIFFLVAAILGLFGGPAMPSTIRIDSMDFFNYLTIISFYDAESAISGAVGYWYRLIGLLAIIPITYTASFFVFDKKDLPI